MPANEKSPPPESRRGQRAAEKVVAKEAAHTRLAPERSGEEHGKPQDSLEHEKPNTAGRRRAKQLDEGSSSGGLLPTMIIGMDEIRALLRYVARRGNIDKDGAITKTLTQALIEYEDAEDDQRRREKESELLEQYSKLTALTYPTLGVNGRTILDTEAAAGHDKAAKWLVSTGFSERRYRAYRIGLALFVLAMALELLQSYYLNLTDPATLGFLAKLFFYINYGVAKFLIPACWGGIGACIYLLKRLSDRLAEKAFDETRLHGDGARIFLGAMLGVIVVILFFPDFTGDLQTGGVSLKPASTAFLSGLGVRAVYGAFEQLVEFLNQKLTGKAPPGQQPPAT